MRVVYLIVTRVPRQGRCPVPRSYLSFPRPFGGLVRVFWLSGDPARRGGSPGPGVWCCLSLEFTLAPGGCCRLRRPHAERSVVRGPARGLALFNSALSQAPILRGSCLRCGGSRPLPAPGPLGLPARGWGAGLGVVAVWRLGHLRDRWSLREDSLRPSSFPSSPKRQHPLPWVGRSWGS